MRYALDGVVGVLADGVVDARRVVDGPALGHKQTPGETVERHVRRHRIADELAEEVDRLRTDDGARILEQVAPLERPVIDELGALEQPVDDLFPLVKSLVGQERAHFLGLGLQADEIEVDAA